MKSIEELYNDVLADPALKDELTAAIRSGKLSAFAQAHNCEASPEDFSAFLTSRYAEAAELSDEQLAGVAGGFSLEEVWNQLISFLFSATVPAEEQKQEHKS